MYINFPIFEAIITDLCVCARARVCVHAHVRVCVSLRGMSVVSTGITECHSYLWGSSVLISLPFASGEWDVAFPSAVGPEHSSPSRHHRLPEV